MAALPQEDPAMEPTRFDDLARAAGRTRSRRAAVAAMLAVAGGALAGARAADAGTTCKGTGARCGSGPGSDTKCCSKRCQNNRCACRDKGGRCAFDSGCCTGRCGPSGRCV